MGLLGAVWGAAGVTGLLLFAVVRLAPIGIAPLWSGELAPVHYLAYAASLAFFAYTEGYRAFQRAFSPRVAARAHSVRKDPQWLRVLLAPAFCMGFFGATRRRLVVSWVLTLGIVLLVVGVRQLPQPWRGAIDLGVVVALLQGAGFIVFYFLQGFGRELPVPDDVPEGLPKVPA